MTGPEDVLKVQGEQGDSFELIAFFAFGNSDFDSVSGYIDLARITVSNGDIRALGIAEATLDYAAYNDNRTTLSRFKDDIANHQRTLLVGDMLAEMTPEQREEFDRSYIETTGQLVLEQG